MCLNLFETRSHVKGCVARYEHFYIRENARSTCLHSQPRRYCVALFLAPRRHIPAHFNPSPRLYHPPSVLQVQVAFTDRCASSNHPITRCCSWVCMDQNKRNTCTTKLTASALVKSSLLTYSSQNWILCWICTHEWRMFESSARCVCACGVWWCGVVMFCQPKLYSNCS